MKRAGANVDFENERGDTALMIAVGNDKADMVRVLKDVGADINFENKFGTCRAGCSYIHIIG